MKIKVVITKEQEMEIENSASLAVLNKWWKTHRATLVQMARGGKDEMAMYMLHNLKPYAIEIAEGGKEKSEPEIDIDALLSALFG